MKPAYRFYALSVYVLFAACAWYADAALAQSTGGHDRALQAFEVVRSVLQHPRCQNCHIPGDSPFQDDQETPHDQSVVRGPTGRGAPANECSSCHQKTNLPLAYGEHAPPGSPGWRLPPPETKMVFNGLSAGELCRSIKDRRATGGKNLAAMREHIRSNGQVAWGWAPGAKRAVPPASRAQTVAAFKNWMDGGAPCPM
ncbi:MAG: Isoquinoline 1-oxidoreductase subunit [Burkholderiales bacterium]